MLSHPIALFLGVLFGFEGHAGRELLWIVEVVLRGLAWAEGMSRVLEITKISWEGCFLQWRYRKQTEIT